MNLRELLFNNTGFKQTLFKNTFWLSFSQAIVRLLKLLLVIYVARTLTVADYGKFNWALSFVTFFTVFSDLGINSISIREFSQNKENEKHVPDLFGLKFFLGISVFCIIFLYSWFFISDFSIKALILILACYAVVLAFDGLFISFFQAREKMEFIAWADIIQAGITVGFGIFFALNFKNSIALAWAYLLAAIAYTIFFVIAYSLQKEKFLISFNIATWKKFLKMSWPVALAGIFGVIYTSTDSVMLGWFKQFEAVAFYNAGQKFIWIAIIPAGLIYSVFFPAVNKMIEESMEKFQKVCSFKMETMITLASPIVFGIIALAPKIIDFGFGANYYPAIGVLKMLTAMVFLSYLIHPFNQLLVSFHKQEYLFWISLSTALINVVLNAILIPKYSFYGAGIATIISYFLAVVLNVYFCRKFIAVDLMNSNLIWTFFIALFSSLTMFYILNLENIYSLHIFITPLIGMISYCFVFYFLRFKILNNYYK